MSRIFTILICALCMLTACGTKAKTDNASTADNGKKSIIIYFSRSGLNYVSGDTIFLEVGNTKFLAQKIVKATGCDEFEIVPAEPYADDYTECVNRAEAETASNARPAYKGNIYLAPYDTIYLGYPIWAGTCPMCVFTFIEAHNGFAGKTVLPYSTHEGSGLGRSIEDLKKACPKAYLKSGVAIKGSTVKEASIDPIINQ